MIRKIFNKIKHKFRPDKAPEPILEMVLGEYQLSEIILSSEYRLRQFDFNSKSDVLQFNDLILRTGMGPCPLDFWSKKILPSGFFVVEYIPNQLLVGTCFASHLPISRHPCGGNLGFLVVDSLHRGKKIGSKLVNSVMKRLSEVGYDRIYLGTHDFRLSAIKIYINFIMCLLYNNTLLNCVDLKFLK